MAPPLDFSQTEIFSVIESQCLRAQRNLRGNSPKEMMPKEVPLETGRAEDGLPLRIFLSQCRGTLRFELQLR